MSKKSIDDRPLAQAAEGATIVVFVEGQYFIFSVGGGNVGNRLRHVRTKNDKHTDEKRINSWKDLAQMLEHPREFEVHFIDKLDVALAAKSRDLTETILMEGKSFRPVQKKKKEKAIDEMVARATEVLGSRDEGMRWLGNPVRGLDFATPISLLGTPEGVERVNDILGQIEHGLW